MKKENAHNDRMLSNLFFKLLPVQILIVAMGSVNSIVDGIMAGRFISAETVGVIGLYCAAVNILSAIGSVLLGGTAVLCGRFMGSGDMQKTCGIFSLNITVSLIAGITVIFVSFLFPGSIADILGADVQLREPLITYITGYAVGIVPMLLGQQIAAFLQLERQSTRCYAAIAGMISTNIICNLLFVVSFDMGIRGLALATSLSNWVYFLILVPHYFTKKAQLRYDFRNCLWKKLPELLKIGLPGAMLVFCIALRNMVLNRVLLTYAGQDGLSAMAAFGMIHGLFLALCLGTGEVVCTLSSIFVGEEDPDSMKAILQIALTKPLFLSVVLAVLVIAISNPLATIFFPDHASNVHILTQKLFIIYGCCLPMVLLCSVSSKFLQASGHNLFVNIQSVFDGFISMVIPALILAPKFGAMGVWLANPIGMVLTLLLVPLYACFYWKHWPRTLKEWMFLAPGFGAEDENRLKLSITQMNDVTKTAVQVQAFCKSRGTSHRIAYFSALCLEEMAANVVAQGFRADRKTHMIDCRVVYVKDHILLRIKDDCIPFDPMECAKLVSPKDPLKNIGIRMVYRIAKEISYQNLLGLNVLTIHLTDEEQIREENTYEP